MAGNRENKYRNALDSLKQHCVKKDELLDTSIRKMIADVKSLVEKAKERRIKNEQEVKVDASVKKSKVPYERSRPVRHAAEVAKTLIHSSMRFEMISDKMRRPENFNPNSMCSTMDILRAEIQSESRNTDQTVSEDIFIEDLKKNSGNTFESTLINGNNKIKKNEPIPNGKSIDLNQLTIPMTTFRNDEETFVVSTDGKKSCETVILNDRRDQVLSESTLKVTTENNANASGSSSSSPSPSSHYSLRSSKKRPASDNNTPEMEKEPKKVVQHRNLSPEKPKVLAKAPEPIDNIVDKVKDKEQIETKTVVKQMIKSSKKAVVTKVKPKIASKVKIENKPKHIIELNLSDIVEEKSDESPECVATITKMEPPRTPRTPRIRTRAMTKRLLLNAATAQPSPAKQIDAQIDQAALKRQEHLEKRRENARRKREDKAKKAFEQREILRTEKLKKLNQKKNKKVDEVNIPNKKQPLVDLKNQPRPLSPSHSPSPSPPSALPTIAPSAKNIRPPPILPSPPHYKNQTKRVTDTIKEPITLNMDECDSDTDEYDCNAVRKVCNWVKKREYDSDHANSELLLQLFNTGPATPNIRDIFEELEENHLLRNSSIWED